MTESEITKTFRLESEPVLHWPKSPARTIRLNGVELNYLGWNGVEYGLHSNRKASVSMVRWDQNKVGGWRDLFLESSMNPDGLRSLAKLSDNLTDQNICMCVSQNGPLGFRPSSGHQISEDSVQYYVDRERTDALIPLSEPIHCIRRAACRAANVMELWSILKKFYGQEPGCIERLQSIVQFIKDDPLGQEDGCTLYRVLVNGESRTIHFIPNSSVGWRKLTTELLAEYIQDHLRNDIRVGVRVQKQNKDEEAEKWNLKPVWHVGSALTAYYVQLLIVMRRFRTCKVCPKDISHQRTNSSYCGSSCRSKNWYRNN